MFDDHSIILIFITLLLEDSEQLNKTKNDHIKQEYSSLNPKISIKPPSNTKKFISTTKSLIYEQIQTTKTNLERKASNVASNPLKVSSQPSFNLGHLIEGRIRKFSKNKEKKIKEDLINNQNQNSNKRRKVAKSQSRKDQA